MKNYLFFMSLMITPLLLQSCDANAHSWYSYRKDPAYHWSCCGGNDCNTFKIKKGNLTATKAGYHIKLSLEEVRAINPNAFFPIDAIVTWDRVQESETNDWNICIATASRDTPHGGIYCLFAPPST